MLVKIRFWSVCLREGQSGWICTTFGEASYRKMDTRGTAGFLLSGGHNSVKRHLHSRVGHVLSDMITCLWNFFILLAAIFNAFLLIKCIISLQCHAHFYIVLCFKKFRKPANSFNISCRSALKKAMLSASSLLVSVLLFLSAFGSSSSSSALHRQR